MMLTLISPQFIVLEIPFLLLFAEYNAYTNILPMCYIKLATL